MLHSKAVRLHLHLQKSNDGAFYSVAAILDDEALTRRMQKLRIREEDLEESFVQGTGPGGQKINKTSSTVVLIHVPTGIQVRCQRERSQSMNRLIARQELCDKLEATLTAVKQEQRDAVEKKRRQNRPRPRGLKERILKDKHARSETKKRRTGKIKNDE
jgi:protein subunit release factor B